VTPALRKFTLTVHVASSVGWLGAVVAYLVLAVVGLKAHEPAMLRGTYTAMDTLGWLVIVPFSLAALLSGLIQSLSTEWGLIRYFWVLAKLALTVIATIILLRYMSTTGRALNTLSDPGSPTAGMLSLRSRAVLHATGGLLVLLTTTTLSVYKPWGRTPWAHNEAKSTMPLLVFGAVGFLILLALLHHVMGGAHMHGH
jgi:hypothetical protein